METYKEFIKRKDLQFRKDLLIQMKDIERKGKFYFKREAWTFLPQYNYKDKVFLIERLKFVKKDENTRAKTKIGDIEYRFAYYIIGKIGKAKNKWTWGQFCPIIPGQDLKKLLRKAKKEGTILA